jgi:adenine/guanine phosphoribosyltransferase-like PRPP-binding protein
VTDTIRPDTGTPNDPATMALLALSWLLSDGERAERLLSLTGMTVDDLRAGASNPRILAEFIRYLEGHEADLIAAADATGTTPAALVNARIQLDRQT